MLKEIQSKIPVHFQANRPTKEEKKIDPVKDPEGAKLQKRIQMRKHTKSMTTMAIMKMDQRAFGHKDFKAD